MDLQDKPGGGALLGASVSCCYWLHEEVLPTDPALVIHTPQPGGAAAESRGEAEADESGAGGASQKPPDDGPQEPGHGGAPPQRALPHLRENPLRDVHQPPPGQAPRRHRRLGEDRGQRHGQFVTRGARGPTPENSVVSFHKSSSQRVQREGPRVRPRPHPEELRPTADSRGTADISNPYPAN